MMEQEVRGVKYTDIRGAIDVTNLSSPPSGHTSSSGYSSEDDQVNTLTGGHADMDSLQDMDDDLGDDMLTAQSHEDGNVHMQNDEIPEVCTDDISFDDLVSSDAWLENMQPDLHRIVSNAGKVDGVNMGGVLQESYAKGDVDMEDISGEGVASKGKNFLGSLLTERSGELGMISMDAQTTLPSRTWAANSSLTANCLANSRSSPMLHAMERLSPPPATPATHRVASTPQLQTLASGSSTAVTNGCSVSSQQQSLLSPVITTSIDRGDKSYVAIPFNLSGLQWQQLAASEAQQKQTLFAIPINSTAGQPAASQARQTLVAIPLSSAGGTKPTVMMQSSVCSVAPPAMQSNKRTLMCGQSVAPSASYSQSQFDGSVVVEDSDNISVKVAKQLLREQLSRDLVSNVGDLDWLTSTSNNASPGTYNIVNRPHSDSDCFSGMSGAETRMVSPLLVTSRTSSPLGSPPPLASPPPVSNQAVFTDTYCSSPSPMFQQPPRPITRQKSDTEKLAILNSIFDDHPYTTNKVNSTTYPSNNRSKSRKSSSGSSTSSQPTSPSVLKQFLLCKEPLNPNKGSDTVLAEEGMSLLNIADGAGSTLKRLLTGQMDKKEVHKCEQRLIETRRQSSCISSPSTSSLPSPCSFSDSYGDDLSSDDFGNMDLLGIDPVTDLESLWQPSNLDAEVNITRQFLQLCTDLMAPISKTCLY